MAQRLLSYDWSRPNKSGTKVAAYPWQEWFDGSIWRIEHGVDFHIHPLMMERVLRTKTTTCKGNIVVRHESMTGERGGMGVIIFQRTDLGVTTNFVREHDPKRPRRRTA